MAREYFGTQYYGSDYWESYYFNAALSAVLAEEYRLALLPRQVPIVDKEGRMQQGFYTWLSDVTDLVPQSGIGSPEGVVEARRFTFYIDSTGSAGSIVYVKQYRDIGGDRTQGWVAV